MVELIFRAIIAIGKIIWKSARWIGILATILIIEVLVVVAMGNTNVDERLSRPDLEIVDCRVEKAEGNEYRVHVKIANRGSKLCRYIPNATIYIGEEYLQEMYLSADSIYPWDSGALDVIPAGRMAEIMYTVLDDGELSEGTLATLVLSEYDVQTPQEFQFQFEVEG